MEQYISKSALVAEIESLRRTTFTNFDEGVNATVQTILEVVDTLEVKEVDLNVIQRMEECPFRRVGCTMYEDKILECNGACSWVVDYPKLKELKAQKGE